MVELMSGLSLEKEGCRSDIPLPAGKKADRPRLCEHPKGRSAANGAVPFYPKRPIVPDRPAIDQRGQAA